MKKTAIPIFISCIIFTAASLHALFKSEDQTIFGSPLTGKRQVLGVNLWLPNINAFLPDADSPKITARSAFFIDTKSGRVLFAKNAGEKLPIASLTKVMTALIALENKNSNDEFLVSEYAANMEPDKMLLIAGEKLTLKELLYGIFLISANDAAEVLAEGTTGSREEFINLMNFKAKQLGMRDSLFVNPTGLDEDFSNSYSSAYDMALLTRYLIRRFPQAVEISKTPHIYLLLTQNHQDYDMYSGINLLTSYPGVVGFKTGYTPEAGLTIITLARKDSHEVIGVLLGSQNRREEVRELLDYSFSKLK